MCSVGRRVAYYCCLYARRHRGTPLIRQLYPMTSVCVCISSPSSRYASDWITNVYFIKLGRYVADLEPTTVSVIFTSSYCFFFFFFFFLLISQSYTTSTQELARIPHRMDRARTWAVESTPIATSEAPSPELGSSGS